MAGTRREIALIGRHYFLPFTDLHIHKVLVGELRLQLLILLLSRAARHGNGH